MSKKTHNLLLLAFTLIIVSVMTFTMVIVNLLIFFFYTLMIKDFSLYITMFLPLVFVFYFYTWTRYVINLIIKNNTRESIPFLKNLVTIYIFLINLIISFFLYFSNLEQYIFWISKTNSIFMNTALFLTFTTLIIFEILHRKKFFGRSKFNI